MHTACKNSLHLSQTLFVPYSRPCMLRSSAVCTWSMNEMLKWNMVQQVHIGGTTRQNKYSHHGNTNNFSYVLKHKSICWHDGGNRTVHALIRNLPSPKFTLKDWSEIRHSPPAAIGLGVGGLIPFISAPAYLIYQGAFCPNIAFAQVAYGAVILSFLGGIKWGCAIAANSAEKPTWMNLGLSTASSLTAWAGLLVPQQLGMVVVANGILVATYVDLISVGYPSWFKALRVTLSSIAVTTLISMLILSFVQKENTKEAPENH